MAIGARRKLRDARAWLGGRRKVWALCWQTPQQSIQAGHRRAVYVEDTRRQEEIDHWRINLGHAVNCSGHAAPPANEHQRRSA
jgi:hypothetical protein